MSMNVRRIMDAIKERIVKILLAGIIAFVKRDTKKQRTVLAKVGIRMKYVLSNMNTR